MKLVWACSLGSAYIFHNSVKSKQLKERDEKAGKVFRDTNSSCWRRKVISFVWFTYGSTSGLQNAWSLRTKLFECVFFVPVEKLLFQQNNHSHI